MVVPKHVTAISFLKSLSTALFLHLLEGFSPFFRLRILASHLSDVPLNEPDPLLAEGKPTQPHPSSSPSRVADLWEVWAWGWAVGITSHVVTSLFISSLMKEIDVQHCSTVLFNPLIRKMSTC